MIIMSLTHIVEECRACFSRLERLFDFGEVRVAAVLQGFRGVRGWKDGSMKCARGLKGLYTTYSENVTSRNSR